MKPSKTSLFMFFASYFYYITIALQGLCVWHCLKKGNQQKWIWIIVFLPIVGCLVYFFSEILGDRQIRNVSSNVGSIINPTGTVRKLEAQLRFADTHQNKVALADAYLNTGETTKAIHLYEESLTGVFDENEYVLMKLIIAYSKVKFYEGILPVAERAYKSPQFARSQAHIEYAKALAALGQHDKAEKEFNLMLGKFANYEPRYHYGIYLMERGEKDKANNVFREIISEEKHLGPRERRMYKEWIIIAKEELKREQVNA